MKVPVFEGSIGLNNKVPAHRLEWNPETGFAALECCENFIVGPSGDLVTRTGFTEIEAGPFHSLHPGIGHGWGLVAKDRTNDCAIYKVDVTAQGDVTLTGIRSGLAKGKRIDFCRVNEQVFYTNGSQNGVIHSDGTSHPWVSSTWYDDESIAQFAEVFPAEHLCYNAGRIYFSKGQDLYWTQYGMLGLYDQVRNVQRFPDGNITAICPAVDGLYVSDQHSIFFLSGLDPAKWQSRRVTSYPILEWGVHKEYVNPSLFGLETDFPSILVATATGPVVLMPSGGIVNLIDQVVTVPDCEGGTGAVCLFDQTLVIQSSE